MSKVRIVPLLLSFLMLFMLLPALPLHAAPTPENENQQQEPLPPAPETDPAPTPDPTPTSTPTPTTPADETIYYITGTMSYGEMSLTDGTLTVVTGDGVAHDRAISDRQQRGEWGTIPAGSFSHVETTGKVRSLEVSYPEGFSGKTEFSSGDLERRGNILHLHTEAEPDTGLSVSESHTTEGKDYKVDYVVRNTGTAPLSIDSLRGCGSFQLLGGAEHTCSLEGRYHMETKPIDISNSFTGTFTYQGTDVDTVKEGVNTRITTPNATSTPTTQPTPDEEEEREPVPEETEKPELPPLPEVTETERESSPWIVAVPLMIIIVSIALMVYIIRKQNKANDKNKLNGKDSTPLNSEAGVISGEDMETEEDLPTEAFTLQDEKDATGKTGEEPPSTGGIRIRPQYPDPYHPDSQ